MNTNYTDITIVLDRSGSMGSIAHDVIGGINTFIDTQKKQPGKATLTLVQFDNVYEIVHNAVDITAVPHLTSDTYKPRGMTALLDAIGRTVVDTGKRLEKMPEAERPGKVLFVIMTDGEENVSTEMTYEKVKEMTEHQKTKYNWDFIFLGANIDVKKYADNLGINSNNAIKFNSTSKGMNTTYAVLSSAVSDYRFRGLNSDGALLDSHQVSAINNS